MDKDNEHLSSTKTIKANNTWHKAMKSVWYLKKVNWHTQLFRKQELYSNKFVPNISTLFWDIQVWEKFKDFSRICEPCVPQDVNTHPGGNFKGYEPVWG